MSTIVVVQMEGWAVPEVIGPQSIEESEEICDIVKAMGPGATVDIVVPREVVSICDDIVVHLFATPED